MYIANFSPKILIIEDNEGDYVLVEEYLSEAFGSTQSRHAKNWAQGLNYLESKEKFDIILLDLGLPDHKGEPLVLDTLKYAHETPVVLLTGYDNNQFALNMIAKGAADYLPKGDLNPSALQKCILYSIERQKTFKSLKESEQKYQSIFQIAPIPIFIVEKENNKILSANAAAIEAYGYTFEEFTQISLHEIEIEEETMQNSESSGEHQNMLSGYFHASIRHQKKNGEQIIVEKTKNSILFGDQVADMILAKDITERVNYLQKIERQYQSLAKIAHIQSHVVRAPLARIMGIAQLIEAEDIISSTEIPTFINILLNSCSELDDVIREISDQATSH